jgi:hypothetical protein
VCCTTYLDLEPHRLIAPVPAPPIWCGSLRFQPRFFATLLKHTNVHKQKYSMARLEYSLLYLWLTVDAILDYEAVAGGHQQNQDEEAARIHH